MTEIKEENINNDMNGKKGNKQDYFENKLNNIKIKKIINDHRNKKMYNKFKERNIFNEYKLKLIKSIDIIIPRNKWILHDKFESQSLILNIHRIFRKKSQEIITLSFNIINNYNENNYKHKLKLRNILTKFNQFKTSIYKHSYFEENTLFPYLIHQYKTPQLKILLIGDNIKSKNNKNSSKSNNIDVYNLNDSQNGHNILKILEDNIVEYIESIFHKYRKHGEIYTINDIRELLKLLMIYDNKLLQHLGEEETIVIPMLLALKPKEYQRI